MKTNVLVSYNIRSTHLFTAYAKSMMMLMIAIMSMRVQSTSNSPLVRRAVATAISKAPDVQIIVIVAIAAIISVKRAQ